MMHFKTTFKFPADRSLRIETGPSLDQAVVPGQVTFLTMSDGDNKITTMLDAASLRALRAVLAMIPEEPAQ